MKGLLARLARQSPAMAVAMIALFVALSGTAVATTSALIGGAQIQNNSIAGVDVKNNSITGADVKNRSLSPADFRGSVRGARGLAGSPGPPGAAGTKGDKGDKGDAGTAATALWAVVTSDATLARGKGVTAVNANTFPRNGQVEVTFNQNIRECAYIATTGNSSNSTSGWSTPPEAQANVSFYTFRGNGTDTVRVETSNSAGTLTPLDFHLAVFC